MPICILDFAVEGYWMSTIKTPKYVRLHFTGLVGEWRWPKVEATITRNSAWRVLADVLLKCCRSSQEGHLVFV